MKKFLEKGKEYLFNNRGKLQSALHFTGKCLGDIAGLTQLESKPSVASYLSVGFKCKEHYDGIFQSRVEEYFLNGDWESIFCHEVWPVAAHIIETAYHQSVKVIKKDNHNSDTIYVVNLDKDVKIGWIKGGSRIDHMYVTNGKIEQAKEILCQKFWDIATNKCISIGVVKINWDTYFSINKEQTHEEFVESLHSKKYCDYLDKYKKLGLGRSVLFYGPPGSGKTNIVKVVANSLDMKTVRLQNLNEIRSKAIVDILDVFNPEAIVLEDIDHLYSYDISTLLEKIEKFNARGKYVLATANEVTKINGALLRPGRFDELIEITNAEPEYLKSVINDDEVFEMVKEYPIAFIMEILKRIKAVGKAEAMANLDDIKKRVENSKKVEYKL